MATAGGPSPVECGVCMETYSRTEHIPKVLPCGHSFCNICLENIVSAGHIPCPVCKLKHPVPGEGIQGFSTVYAILDVLDLTCSRCQKFGQTSRCPHCPLNMCTTCLDDHVQSEYSTSVQQNLHKVLRMKNEQQTEFEAFVGQMKNLHQNVDEFYAKSREVINIEVNQDILKQLDEKSSQFSEALKDVTHLLTRCRISVDPDLPCFKLLKSTSMKFIPSDVEISESSQAKLESSQAKLELSKKKIDISKKQLFSFKGKVQTSHKKVESAKSRRKSDTYTSVPHLVTGSKGRGPGQLQYPWGAAVDVHSGDVYVADHYNSRICVYGADYTYKSAFDVGSRPRALCFTTDGDVVVTYSNNTVRVHTKSGSLKQTIGEQGKRKGEVDNPAGIVSDSDGHLHVCDRDNRRVQVLDKSGAVVRVLGTRAHGQLEEPWSAAVHPLTKQVYVADYGKDQVNIYSSDGQYEACIEEADIPGISDFWPGYVSFSDDGLLCISDWANFCMYLMRDGRVTQRIGQYGSAHGQFDHPLGTTFSGAGDLIVCDWGNDRIQIFCTN